MEQSAGQVYLWVDQMIRCFFSLSSMFQGPHSVDFFVSPNTGIVCFWLVDRRLTEGTVVQFALFAHFRRMHPSDCLQTVTFLKRKLRKISECND